MGERINERMGKRMNERVDARLDARLSAAGYKLTGPRRRILTALHTAQQPLTAQEVAALAATSVASTYRVLALLVELGVVGESPDPGEGCDVVAVDGSARAAQSTPPDQRQDRRPAPAGQAHVAFTVGERQRTEQHSEQRTVTHTEAPPGETDARGRRYRLCSTSVHHHHFACRSCHALIEVASDALERALAELADECGLAVERHEVTLSGLCAACHASSATPAATAQAAPGRPMAPVASGSSERRVAG